MNKTLEGGAAMSRIYTEIKENHSEIIQAYEEEINLKGKGKSLEFVKKRMDEGHVQKISLDEANESNFLDELKIFNKDVYSFFKETKIELIFKQNENERKHTVTYNPGVDFDYVATEYCVCDGTMIFIQMAINKILNRLFTGQTYNNETDYDDNNYWGYNVKYTVGDFVINHEYSEKDFATEEQPWLQSRYTVFLPIQFSFEKTR